MDQEKEVLTNKSNEDKTTNEQISIGGTNIDIKFGHSFF